MHEIWTASWFTVLHPAHVRIGISRGIPRRVAAGYRIYRKLAPGPWFHSVTAEEFDYRYRTEILQPLDPRIVAAELVEIAGGGVPVLLCYERAGRGDWCHRAMAAGWLAEGLGRPVREVGYEHLAQQKHPLLPPQRPSQAQLFAS